MQGGARNDGVRHEEAAGAADHTTITELREALRPFFEYARYIAREHPCWDHDTFDTKMPSAMYMPMRYFRRAAEVYARTDNLPAAFPQDTNLKSNCDCDDREGCDECYDDLPVPAQEEGLRG